MRGLRGLTVCKRSACGIRQRQLKSAYQQPDGRTMLKVVTHGAELHEVAGDERKLSQETTHAPLRRQLNRSATVCVA
jgi:hypothetical protein